MSMQRTRFERAVSALTDPGQTLLVLVARPEKTALAEAAHTSAELMDIGLRHQHLLINGVFHAADSNDDIALAFQKYGRACMDAMPSVLQALPRDEVPLRSFDTNSLPALRALLTSGDVEISPVVSASHSQSVVHIDDSLSTPRLQALIDELAMSSHGLVMVMGKGGVGKTTVAAALAAGLVAHGHRVHLSTTDPSAHLVATLNGGELPGLIVSRIDPVEEKRRYIDNVMATRGATLDESGRALLAEDLRSPCTEEVAVFEAFSRDVESSSADFVVLDTAPTGHSLLLIDAAGAYQRQAERERQLGPQSGSAAASSSAPAPTPASIVSPLTRLRDPTQTRVVIVTTPEPTPVSQAAALQADLLRAGIHAYGWVLNRSLAATHTTDPLLLARQRSERIQYERISAGLTRRLFVVPFSPVAPVGLDALTRLSVRA
jgi:arsenite-transporting ATPase